MKEAKEGYHYKVMPNGEINTIRGGSYLIKGDKVYINAPQNPKPTTKKVEDDEVQK